MEAPSVPVISPSTFTHIVDFILGFVVSILAMYFRKRLEETEIKKRTILAIANEINENRKILEETTRIFNLKTVVWENMNSYLVRNETTLFLKISDLYSDINTRNDIIFLHNISKCFTRSFDLDLEDDLKNSGEWLDENAEKMLKKIEDTLTVLNNKIG